jgi:uncharacterized membrane protein
MRNERRLRFASALVAVGGVAITVYLLYVRASGATLACTTGGCETVQHSAYAEVFGLPVAALGLTAFAGIVAAALARGGWARVAQATLALSAVLFSAYLLWLQVGRIGALCQWCLGSDLLITLLAALALVRLGLPPLATATAPVRPGPKKRPQGSRTNRKPRPQQRPQRR